MSQRVLAALTLVGGLVLSSTSTHAVVVIGDFEGSDPGAWGRWSSGVQPFGPPANVALSTEDSSRGTTSVKATNVGYQQNLAYGANAAARTAFAVNTTLMLDVITTPSSAPSGYWQVFELILNSQGGGWTNVTSGLTNTSGTGNNIYWGPGPGDDGRRVVTFSLDYSAVKSSWSSLANGTPGWVELVFSLNNDGATNPEHAVAYIDNVRLVGDPAAVPEPAAVGVAGVAAVGALMRRHRRA